MIRLWIASVSAAGLLLAYNAESHNPKPPVFSGVEISEVSLGDSSQYWIRYGLNKIPRVGDSIKIAFRRDTVSGLAAISQVKWRFFKVDSGAFTVAKAYGKLAKFSGCVSIKNNTYISTPVCRTWSTTKIDSVPPIVDSVGIDSSLSIIGLDVKPDTLHLQQYYLTNGGGIATLPSPNQQFCAFVVFEDGMVALRTKDTYLTTCQLEYSKFPVSRTKVTFKQQEAADKFCPQWTATGGTITNEDCGSPS